MTSQCKLTKLDWTQMEKRVSEKELVILNMIKNSFQGTQLDYVWFNSHVKLS